MTRAEYRKIFDEVVISLFKETNSPLQDMSFDIGSEKGSYTPARSQYKDCIFWFRFRYVGKKRLKEKYRDVEAIHIMPFCLTSEDIQNENLKLSYDAGKSEIGRNTTRFDLCGDEIIDCDCNDVKTGFNFHKNVDVSMETARFQVVLVKKDTKPKGPGCNENGCLEKDFNRGAFIACPAERLKYVKTDWYFPSIQPKGNLVFGDNKEKLKELLALDLKNMLEEIFEEETLNSSNDRISASPEKDNLGVQYNQALDFLAKLTEYVDDVDSILKDVATHYNADRAYVFNFSEDRKTIDNTFEWCKPGIEPQIGSLQEVPYESVSAWVREFEKSGAFFISSLDKDVEATSLTYEILEPQGINSLIAAPIYKGDRIIGFIGVDNPHANLGDIVILKVTASILYSEISEKISTKNQAIKEMTKAQLKNNAELGEIRDIVASANMGIWRIELVENEEPRMYVDDTMKRLLGIEEQELTPEKTYDDWFYNITPEAVPSVLNSVERMEQGHFDENTYLWTHPLKGTRYVRCGGTAKSIPGGYLLQGYHYDVDEVVRKNQAQMLKLKKAMEDKKEYYDALGALGDIFYSMHVIDLKKDEVVEFSAKNEVKEIVNRKKGAAHMMEQVMTAVTSEEYREKALQFTNLKTLPERMENRTVLSEELFGIYHGWFLASFITMEKDKTGRPTKVIYTSRIIDEEKKQQEKLISKTQTDEMTGLLNRRAYEEKINESNTVPLENKFIYMSIDANGLKVINDTKGHAAGDELLTGISQCMKKCLGPYGNLYRIGGDEFVAILFCDGEEIKKVLKDFDDTISNWRGRLIDELSLSYGWIDKNELPNASTKELEAIAEQRMYKEKSAYYSSKGVDRRGQQDAHRILCNLYTKILKINLTTDTYTVVNMDFSEQSLMQDFSGKLSEWLISFGKSGFVHPDDLEEYLSLTDRKYLIEYFRNGKTMLHIFYRRKYGDEFKQVMMEIVPANDYTEDNMSLFMYIKNIDR